MATESAVIYRVEPTSGPRNRLTVAFRPILAIPHLLLVGGPGVGFGIGSDRTGVFGAVAGVTALINWFAIIIKGRPIESLMNLQIMYLKWRANALAYEALLRDEYPPFGEGTYPVQSSFPAKMTDRNRWSVGFRLLLVIPQVVVFVFVLLAWVVTVVIGWFSVLFTGAYPEGLWRFGEGVMRWELRLETYMLLLDDAYPPFSLQ